MIYNTIFVCQSMDTMVMDGIAKLAKDAVVTGFNETMNMI